jgi:ribosomal protein S1
MALAVKKNEDKKEYEEFKKLLAEHFIAPPKEGDTIKGKILSVSNGEARIDVGGLLIGVVRGLELAGAMNELKAKGVGEEVEAVVLELENENGEMELSLKSSGAVHAWGNLLELVKAKTPILVRVREANKGGLMATLDNMVGFLPVSQLSPEHYPRVQGGDKSKILEKLREFVGKDMKVCVLDADEKEQKLIFSEKALWENEQKDVLQKYKVGDIIEGEISALADFGAFMRFEDGLEGLIHISELVWQRIDHPRDVVAIGQKVKAQIIQLDGSKIFLSLKRLMDDPWRQAGEKYKVGQVVKGKVLKTNSFGLFVELDKDIHGLAHVSELSDAPVKDVNTFAKAGDELDFEIVSLEPAAHRLGLRIPGVKPKAKPKKEEKSEEAAAPVEQA